MFQRNDWLPLKTVFRKENGVADHFLVVATSKALRPD